MKYVAYLLILIPEMLCAQAQLPELKEFNFVSESIKVLPGTSTEAGNQWNCSGQIFDHDMMGSIAIVSEVYQNGCYTDGKYNHTSFKVEAGRIESSVGDQFEAYRLHEPAQKASQFLGSQHKVHIKFDKVQSFTIYAFENGAIKSLTTIPAERVVPGQYIKIDAFSVSTIVQTKTIFVAPEDKKISIYHELADGVEGASILKNGDLEVSKKRFQVDGLPVDTDTKFPYGVDSHENVYGDGRHFNLIQLANGRVGVVWQDQENGKVYLSTVNFKGNILETRTLPRNEGYLAAATSDENDNIYYLMVTDGTGNVRATIHKVTNAGQFIRSKSLNTSKAELNIWRFGGGGSSSNSASLVYNKKQLGVIISRQMHAGNDGLNHQGAIGLTFDSETLEYLLDPRQTSSHSFDNILYADKEEGFIGMDLADNYPRGINLHRFKNNMASKVVYSFKTRHGTKATSPAGRSYPLYREISGNETFYKWSNDNNTYSELGGISQYVDGYGIYFIGEPNEKGEALDNSQAIGRHYDARNIGFIKVKRDWKYGEEYIVSKGVNEVGGFYTFGGSWSELENKGIVWLTAYNDPENENASRLKSVLMPDGATLVIWEKWSKRSYQSTYMMLVDENGKQISKNIEIGNHLRLNRRSEPLIVNDKVYLVSGSAVDRRLEVVEIEIK